MLYLVLTIFTKSWNETTPFPFIARSFKSSNSRSCLFKGTCAWNVLVLKAAIKSFAGISPNPSASIYREKEVTQLTFKIRHSLSTTYRIKQLLPFLWKEKGKINIIPYMDIRLWDSHPLEGSFSVPLHRNPSSDQSDQCRKSVVRRRTVGCD